MTDTWSDGDPDFFRLTDEAWWSYCQRQLRGSDAEMPAVSSRQPAYTEPPKVDRRAGSGQLGPLLEALEFKPSCEAKGCENPARWYVQIHWPNFCGHPSMQDQLLHQIVCDRHLEMYEQRAEKIVRDSNPPAWVRWFRKDVNGKCSTCGARIQTAADVLQVVRSI